METPRRRRIFLRHRALSVGCLALMLAPGLAACTPLVRVQIDYINFVQFGGITYVLTASTVGRTPAEGDLGPVYNRVRFKLDGHVDDPNYQAKDGDASYLDEGTPVYTVKGYAPTSRLAAYFAGRLTFYEADTNPKAKTGADLLDIGGKVQSIDVDSDGTTVLAAIDDPEQVARLVALVLAAPVDQQRQETTGVVYSLAFHLADGTAVVRGYWADSGLLNRGILTPPAFRAAVEEAVHAGKR